MPAYPTFPKAQGPKYHRVCALSLLCSEWEEVGHTQMKHRQTARMVRQLSFLRPPEADRPLAEKQESRPVPALNIFTETEGLDPASSAG